MPPHILILAAGASSRMAPRDKLLEQIDGQPLIARSLRTALATGLPVTLTLPPDRPKRWQAVDRWQTRNGGTSARWHGRKP
jgi:CTP:molybdopterin cytidylyltransferase MocA